MVELTIDPSGPVRLRGLRHASSPERLATAPTTVPVVEVGLLGEGRRGISPGSQHRHYATTQRLRYVSHEVSGTDTVDRLQVTQHDVDSGLTVVTAFEAMTGTAAVRCLSTVTNHGDIPVTLEFVSSMVLTAFTHASETLASDTLRVGVADNCWTAESRWREARPQDLGLVDVGRVRSRVHDSSQARFPATALGSWSSADFLPMGYVRHRPSNACWLWQVEHNGSWHWELGDLGDELYLVTSGPTQREHGWARPLEPGMSFTTVPCTVAVSPGGVEGACCELTRYRRAKRRPNQDDANLPVIFNDYMNCLMGDPTADKLRPLITAASQLGCEYFVIDAGWYAEDTNWWHGVGSWEPSATRFPGGLATLLDEVRAAGMVPGLWIEPEVMGINSTSVSELPDEAFFTRDGCRVVEHGRFQLDFRHPAVVARMDGVIDRLVGELGAGYLKFDYNINIGSGTDLAAHTAADGLLNHNRAFLTWVDRIFRRHPDLVIENCSAGGMRTDFAQLSRMSIHSTSDQRDYLLYPPIAANSPLAVNPEQAAIWAYPQPEFTDDQIDFALATALLGRIHLSGRVDLLDEQQRQRVASAIRCYKMVRATIPNAVPHWPLGRAGWYDDWIALALESAHETLLTVWRRDGPPEVRLDLSWLAGRQPAVTLLHPADRPVSWQWSEQAGALEVSIPVSPAARILRIDHAPPAHVHETD